MKAKGFKAVISILMTAIMLTVSLPLTTSATGNVCKIGDTEYASVKAAVDAAVDGDIIDVFANSEVSSKMVISKKIELTSSNSSQIRTTLNDTFVIGTGTTESDTPGELILSGNLVINSKDASSRTVFIKYGTFTIKDEAHCKTNKRYFIDSPAVEETKVPVHINIFGGTIESASDAKDKATIFFGGKNSTLTMTGGALIQKSSGSYAIKNQADNGKINISGGHIQAVTTPLGTYGAYVGKEINISGGIVEATKNNVFATFSSCDYLTINISGDAILKAKKNTLGITSPMSEINVTGGTIIATEDTPINMGYGSLNISGGRFILEGTSKKATLLKTAYDEDNPFPAFITITGGLFINKNESNPNVMNDSAKSTEPIDFKGGTVLYHDSVDSIVRGRISAPKTVTAIYEGESYYVYTKSGATDEKLSGVMDEGATLRLVEGSAGLRFGAAFSKSAVEKLEEKGAVSYGMIIVPSQYLVNLKTFTVEGLTEKYGADGFISIACTEGTGLVKNGDGGLSLQAAIVNIKEESYGRSFSAIAYACVNGEYYYSAFDQTANSASVKDLAEKALAAEGSAHTDAELSILNEFAGN